MWLVAAAVLLLGLIACGIVCVKERPVDGIVALSVGSVIVTLTLLLLAVGFDRSPYADLPLTLAVLTFAGELVFIRFVERWE